MDYVLTVNGEVIDESEEGEPLQFIQGKGHIIPGLEKALYGMTIGDSKNVEIAPLDGYGMIDPDAFMDISREEFPDNIPLDPGVQLSLRDQDDNVMPAVIASVDDQNVHLDLNHPLAGKDLHFDVKIVALRPATQEELAHGHVHGH